MYFKELKLSEPIASSPQQTAVPRKSSSARANGVSQEDAVDYSDLRSGSKNVLVESEE